MKTSSKIFVVVIHSYLIFSLNFVSIFGAQKPGKIEFESFREEDFQNETLNKSVPRNGSIADPVSKTHFRPSPTDRFYSSFDSGRRVILPPTELLPNKQSEAFIMFNSQVQNSINLSNITHIKRLLPSKDQNFNGSILPIKKIENGLPLKQNPGSNNKFVYQPVPERGGISNHAYSPTKFRPPPNKINTYQTNSIYYNVPQFHRPYKEQNSAAYSGLGGLTHHRRPIGFMASILNFIKGGYENRRQSHIRHKYETSFYSGVQEPQESINDRIANWFSGFKVPSKNIANTKLGQKGEFLDYGEYDVDPDHNLVFYNKTTSSVGQALFDFQDVLQSVKRNETMPQILKKLLSASASLSTRAGTNPVFMMWTIPTTLFAILGIFYFIGAFVILSYKYLLFLNDSSNGQLVSMFPVILSFGIPIIVALVIILGKNAAKGKLNLSTLLRRTQNGAFLRQNFDGVDFTLDTMFTTSALLGIGWLVSITL